jgi:hypothetical protein
LRRENERVEDQAIKNYAGLTTYQRNELENALIQKEEAHKRKMGEMKRKNDEQFRIEQENYENSLKRIQELNQNRLKEVDRHYEKENSRLQSEAQKNLKELSNKFQKEMNDAKEKDSKSRRIYQSRSIDPFYSLTRMEPVLVKGEKEYLLKIKIPRHEADSVMVSGEGRKIKISQSRRFSDEFKGPDGSRNKTARSEFVGREIKTDDIIDPRKITSKYEGDTLFFKIPKA